MCKGNIYNLPMIQIIHGNILETPAEAIVNPAHTSLLAGSGLCGVIHKHAGVELEKHCESLGEQQYGDVVLTPAFGLTQFQYIIHVCSPRWWDGSRGEADTLRRTYENIRNVVTQGGISSVVIPALATGIYRFPVEVAAEIALEVLSGVDFDVTFVNMEQEKHECYLSTYNSINQT